MTNLIKISPYELIIYPILIAKVTLCLISKISCGSCVALFLIFKVVALDYFNKFCAFIFSIKYLFLLVVASYDEHNLRAWSVLALQMQWFGSMGTSLPLSQVV